MRTTRLSFLLWALLLLALLLLPAQAHAQLPAPTGAPTGAPPGAPPGAAQAAGARAVMVELTGPPAAVVYAQEAGAADAFSTAAPLTTAATAATAAAQAQLAANTAAQAALRAQVDALGAPVLFSVQRVYNGVAVLADAEQIAALAALPGVAAVHPLIPKEPAVSSSVPFLGIPSLWARGGALNLPDGLRGEGIRIAIVDTGIDYLHRDFGGPGTGYLANDRTLVGDVAGYPGVRVLGGYDFVGDNYNASAGAAGEQQIPQPDPDPMDCYGHGTHVAGIAGGSGVTAGYTTYAGPYDGSTDFGNLHIGPGIAPRASLYALKVFGCFGSTNLTDLAIEWAVDPNQDGDFADHMDVINLSLGSPYGWEYDTSAIAADNAARVGVIVVASAGNSGDIQLISSAPGSAARAISVAATQRSSDTGTSFSSRGPRRGDLGLKPDLAAPGAGITSADSGTGYDRRSASGTSMAAPHVAGIMALLRQAHPDWSVEALKALAMNTAAPIVSRAEGPSAQPWLPVRVGAGRIDPQAALRATATVYAAGGSGRVSLSFGAPEVADYYTATQEIEISNHTAAPQTFAPSYGSLAQQPGVRVTVGADQVTVPPQGKVRVPVTLAVTARELQHRQAPADHGSYLLTTWFAEESGQLFLWPADELPAQRMLPETPAAGLEASAAGPAAAYQFSYAPAARTLSYTITLSGLDASAVSSVTLGYGRAGEPSSVLAALPRPAGGALITGSLTLEDRATWQLAAGLLHLRLASPALAGGPRRGPLVYAGGVLHLPVYAAPRPTAAMHVTPTALSFALGATQPITFAGRDLQGGIAPTDVVALASVLELKLRSPNTRPAWLDANAPDRFDHADLQYVGVTSDAAFGGAARGDEARLYVGITTWGDWSTPAEIGVSVLLDTNGDGEHDFRVTNGTPPVPAFGAGPVGPLVSQIYDLGTGQLVAQQPLNSVDPTLFDTNLFFTNALVLPVRLADVGIGPNGGTISFVVQTTSADTLKSEGKFIDRTPVLRFDPLRPALSFSPAPVEGPVYRDRHGAQLDVRVNGDVFPFQPPAGVLVIHHHNGSPDTTNSRADAIAIDYRWPWTMYLPVVKQLAAP